MFHGIVLLEMKNKDFFILSGVLVIYLSRSLIITICILVPNFLQISHSNSLQFMSQSTKTWLGGFSGFGQKRCDILQSFQTQTKCSGELKVHSKNVEKDLSSNICLTISNHFVISLSVESFGL